LDDGLSRVDIFERTFDAGQVLDVAIRTLDGGTAIDLGSRAAPPLPVLPALREVLPLGLTRGSTLSISGSVSLLLAVLGAASAEGAWCALVGLPPISAEAAAEYGIDLSRLAIVPRPGSAWTTVVGALLDAVEVVAVRPVGKAPALGEVNRLAARARRHDAVLLPFLVGSDSWPGADVRLEAHDRQWSGISAGRGRLRERQLDITVHGRGKAARPRTAKLWLPAAGGGVSRPDSIATLTPIGGPAGPASDAASFTAQAS
jgi:hypothetical protein